ncbi:MAG: hypothetical protein R2827_14555 [Bdellovibrionales bacterium]
MGQLPLDVIDEASGLVATSEHLLHINDSGAEAEIFWTRWDGTLVTKYKISSSKYYDTEGLAFFEQDGAFYLIIGDIGDNQYRRGTSTTGWFSSLRSVPKTALHIFKLSSLSPHEPPQFLHTISLSFPDGPHNSEGIAVHPKTGDLYLITKESQFENFGHKPSQLLRIDRNAWISGELDEITWKKVRDIPFHEINATSDNFGKLTTGFDIAADGTFVILTYDNAISIDEEAALNDKVEIKKDENTFVIPTVSLIQEEAISFVHGNSKQIFYTSERGLGINPLSDEAPIYMMQCKD